MGSGRFQGGKQENTCMEISRTDLHCEPIGNVAVQLYGKKKWTLVDPSFSHLLRPTIAKDGRAYYFSSLDPKISLDHIPKYEIITEAGDALWVPPWYWHRVDYIDNGVSFAASLFHFRPYDFFLNNPLYSILVTPNLVKELLRFKIE